MDDASLSRQWLELSGAWIQEAREGRNPTRVGLLDAPMLAACGDVTGLEVVDCGCGEGRFGRLLANCGARRVLGVDRCPPMIEAARQLQSDAETYRIADVQDMAFVGDETFDLAVSYLNQCDLPDFLANNRAVFRVLRPGGRFVVANLHPMRSAVGGWHRAADGNKEHVVLDRYFDEGARRWKIMGVELTNFHRSLSTYVNGFFDAGFSLIRIVEPTVAPEQLEKLPELKDELRVPNFIVYLLRKPIARRAS